MNDKKKELITTTEKNKDFKNEILKILRGNQLSTREISEELGATYGTTLKYLEILNASLMIENKIFGKTKVWTIKKINPLELDQNSLLFIILKNSNQNNKNNDQLIEILNTFYSKAFRTIKSEFKNLGMIEAIKRYIEILKDSKWKEINDFEINGVNDSINIKIKECKYKFGCCYNIKKDNIPIFCIQSYGFLSLFKNVLNKNINFDLIHFGLSPNYCTISFKNQDK
ncbi:MAG: transcriptional regulator [Candidatus Lokiarchaeota archaeon]|nr:transcriptional regulator [Candidatus Lokiarchaeota archaeon]